MWDVCFVLSVGQVFVYLCWVHLWRWCSVSQLLDGGFKHVYMSNPSWEMNLIWQAQMLNIKAARYVRDLLSLYFILYLLAHSGRCVFQWQVLHHQYTHTPQMSYIASQNSHVLSQMYQGLGVMVGGRDGRLTVACSTTKVVDLSPKKTCLETSKATDGFSRRI